VTKTAKPRRSALYMPASNARALEKAKGLDADGLILDLEDAVAPDAKDLAREQACAAIAAGGFGSREVILRVNGLDTAWGHADVAAAAKAGADAILFPKISTAAEVARCESALADAGALAKTRLWIMIETPLAILNLGDIAAASARPTSRLSCFVMGTNDLAKETRARLTPGRLPMLGWLSTAVAAARAYGLEILDGVYNGLQDEAGLIRECEEGRDMGMDGKTLIHPNQIGPANRVFAPSDQEVDQARAIVAAFDLPENRLKGVITVEGRMVELMHAEMGRRTLAIAAAIAARQG
jgi:citrate lyase subunit beta/citryl-CoA lyase